MENSNNLLRRSTYLNTKASWEERSSCDKPSFGCIRVCFYTFIGFPHQPFFICVWCRVHLCNGCRHAQFLLTEINYTLVTNFYWKVKACSIYFKAYWRISVMWYLTLNIRPPLKWPLSNHAVMLSLFIIPPFQMEESSFTESLWVCVCVRVCAHARACVCVC